MTDAELRNNFEDFLRAIATGAQEWQYSDGESMQADAAAFLAQVERLRAVERKALDQSEYIQTHGLTEIEVHALRAENAELGKRYNELANLVDRRMGELEAGNKRLRAALEAVEYADMESRCPWCGNWYNKGHAPNCQRQVALGA